MSKHCIKYRFKYRNNAPFAVTVFSFFSAVPNAVRMQPFPCFQQFSGGYPRPHVPPLF